MRVNIIGAGLAGLSAARTLSESGVFVRLFSVQPSERAQSNLAEGGINGALNVMGEDDTACEHYEDTMRGGVYLADPKMVRALVEAAPEIISDFEQLGVPFHRADGHIIQRNFGGQKKKRTAYAKSSTGKVLTVAMIDAVRRLEAEGRVERFTHHSFERVCFVDELKEHSTRRCIGVQLKDIHTGASAVYGGPVLIATGGMNGMFGGETTGTTANTGSVTARLFADGVKLSNLEFLQYHPTTVAITGKRMLISEAARGEGGRLFIKRDGKPFYFMEERYGAGGNLMPRDVISREMARLGQQVYLDLTGLSKQTWEEKLTDMRREIMDYLKLDAAEEPIPVAPGIHYFMGGIAVNREHRTNIEGLYAAGECAAAYHGANRLGGNSLLGAVFGGRTAAEAILRGDDAESGTPVLREVTALYEAERATDLAMQQTLVEGLGVLRDHEGMSAALHRIDELIEGAGEEASDELSARLLLAKAHLMAALFRKESRGAHTRTDCPETKEACAHATMLKREGAQITVCYAGEEA